MTNRGKCLIAFVGRMLAQRDEVWVYNRVVGADGRQIAGMDMFRLAAGRVTEHWAIAEQVPSGRKKDNDNYRREGARIRLQSSAEARNEGRQSGTA
jgi:hypothetical protein